MVKYTTEETEHLKLSRLLESVRNVNEHLNEAKVSDLLPPPSQKNSPTAMALLSSSQRKRDNANRMAIIQSTLILGKSTKVRLAPL